MDYQASEHLIPIFDFGVLHLELNTALFILVLVLVVMYAMNRLLFQPVLRTLDNRAASMEQIREATARHAGEVEQLEKNYEARLAKVREEVLQFRNEARREAQAEVAAILDEAREASGRDLESSLSGLEEELKALRGELFAGVEGLSERITQRVLEKS